MTASLWPSPVADRAGVRTPGERTGAGLPSRPRRGGVLSRLPRFSDPAWPVIALVGAYPLWWALGFGDFIFIVMAVPMVIRMVTWRASRGRGIRVPPGFGWWLLFLVCALAGAATLSLTAPETINSPVSGRILSFSVRILSYLSVTVLLLYAGNLSERELPRLRLAWLLGFAAIYTTAGGVAGVVAPHFGFSSPLLVLLPHHVQANPYILAEMHPSLAQVQNVLGGSNGRPDAPFPYTNTWGNCIALLLPWLITAWWIRGTRRQRRIAGAVLVISIVPILYSLNRGLWLALIFMVLYLAVRLAALGRTALLTSVIGGLVLVALVFFVTPVHSLVSQRLANGHSDARRGQLAILALQGAASSPLVGYGDTRHEIGSVTSIAVGRTAKCPQCGQVSVGNNGQLWLLLICSGFLGAGLYLGFFAFGSWRFWRDTSPEGIAGVLVLLLTFVFMIAYDAVGAPLGFTMLAYALLWRNDKARREEAGHRWAARALGGGSPGRRPLPGRPPNGHLLAGASPNRRPLPGGAPSGAPPNGRPPNGRSLIGSSRSGDRRTAGLAGPWLPAIPARAPAARYAAPGSAPARPGARLVTPPPATPTSGIVAFSPPAALAEPGIPAPLPPAVPAGPGVTPATPPGTEAEPGKRRLAGVARGSALNLVGAAFSGAATVAVTLIVTRNFSKPVAGAFFTALSLFLIVETVASLGGYVGLVNFIAGLRSQGREHHIPAILRAALLPVAVVSVVAAVGMALAAGPLAKLVLSGHLGQAGATPGAVATTLRAFAVALPFAALLDTLLGASRGYSAMRPTVVIDRLGRSALQLAGAGVAVAVGATSLLAPLWVLPYVPAAALAWMWLRRIRRRHALRLLQNTAPQPSLAASRRTAARVGKQLASADTRGFWRFTAPRAIAALAQITIQRLDIVLVAILRGPAQAAVYTAATRFLVAGQFTSVAIQQAAQPRFAGLFAVGDRRGANIVYQATTAWLMLLTWPFYLLTMIYGPEIVTIFGHSYRAGAKVMVILGAAMLLSTACGQVDMVLITTGRSSWSLANGLFAVAVNVGLDLLLIPRYGITGAAIGWAAAIAAANLVPLAQLALAARVHPFGRGTLVACALPVLTLGLLPLAARALGAHGKLTAAAAVTAGCALLAVGVWRFRGALQLRALPVTALARGRGN